MRLHVRLFLGTLGTLDDENDNTNESSELGSFQSIHQVLYHVS